jgi:hypothetical protein
MSPLQVLHNHYVGKQIVGGADCPPEFIGAEIVDVTLEDYEPMFVFCVRQPNVPPGKFEYFNVLDDWEIDVRA